MYNMFVFMYDDIIPKKYIYLIQRNSKIFVIATGEQYNKQTKINPNVLNEEVKLFQNN